MNDLQLIGQVYARTGKHLRLGMFERPLKAKFSDDTVRILIERVWYKDRRTAYVVTHTGRTLHTFTRKPNGTWDHEEDTQKRAVGEELWYVSANYQTDPERTVQTEWEDMCYRPGSSASPMDSVARQNQGYK